MVITIVLVLLGLCLGSFVNALVWRIHQIESSKKLSAKRRKELSIFHGRSMCVHCGHRLDWKDLLPIVSWIVLRGKCQYCNRPIHWQYPLVELSTALLFIFSFAFWPENISGYNWIAFVTWLICLVGLVALFVYDLKYMLLPHKIVYPLISVAIVGTVLELILTKNTALLISATLGAVVGGGIFYVLFKVSGGNWIGGGDVKLGYLLGILVGGPAESLLMIFLASLIGTFYMLPLMARRKLKAKSQIPFGPFLIVATIITVLFGHQIIDWYTNSFL